MMSRKEQLILLLQREAELACSREQVLRILQQLKQLKNEQ